MTQGFVIIMICPSLKVVLAKQSYFSNSSEHDSNHY
jgi:hypothetical protein